MRLSVILTTRDRCQSLERTLMSLARQSLPQDQFEVMVVDNGSTDQTPLVCQRWASRLKHFRFFLEERPGLHRGRNLGVLQARAPIAVICDDDIEAFPTWLEGVLESFQDPQVGLVGGKDLPKFEVFPPAWLEAMWNPDPTGERFLGQLSLVDLGDELKEVSPFMVFGCNFSIRRQIVIEAGGFHPDGMPKDTILLRGDGETYISQRVKESPYRAAYNPRASVYHEVPKSRMTAEYFGWRSYIQGISDSYAAIRYQGPREHVRRSSRALISLGNSLYRADKLHQKMKREYLRGLVHHGLAATRSTELRAWIHKSSYFETISK